MLFRSSDNSSNSENDDFDSFDEDSVIEDDMFVQDHVFFCKHKVTEVTDEDLIHCLTAAEDFDKPPVRLSQALSAPDGEQWKAAMISEIQSHLKNETFTVTDAPPGTKTVGSTVVLRIKPGVDGAPGRDRKSTRLNSSHSQQSRMPSSA